LTLIHPPLVGFSDPSKMYIRFVAAALMGHLTPKSKFLRAGRWSEVESAILVPRYIVSVKFGDIIPIDAPLLEGDPLKIDQSAATEIPIAMPISAIAAKAQDETALKLVCDDVFSTPVYSDLLCFYVSRQFLGVLAGYTSSRLYQMFIVFDHCLSMDLNEKDEVRQYVGGTLKQLLGCYSIDSFLVFNLDKKENQIASNFS
jgi:hypothetical protein